MINDINGVANNEHPTLFYFSIHHSYRYKKSVEKHPWYKAVFSCYSATQEEAIKVFETEISDIVYSIDKIERSSVTWGKKEVAHDNQRHNR